MFVYFLNTHLLSVERIEARDANIWQREFPVRFSVKVSALNSLFNKIFHDGVAFIENRCVVKTKHVLLVCSFVRFWAGKLFPRKIELINRPTRHVFLHNQDEVSQNYSSFDFHVKPPEFLRIWSNKIRVEVYSKSTSTVFCAIFIFNRTEYHPLRYITTPDIID